MAQARILTDREFRKVLLHIAAHKHAIRNKCILYMSHLAGLRVGEISHLTIKNVLADDGTIKDEVYLRPEQTKGSRGRTVLLPEKLRSELHEYLSARFRLKDLAIVNYTDTNRALFDNQKSRIRGFTPNGLASWFCTLFRKVGIDGASSHSGRRHFATYLSENSVSPKVIQTLLGHRQLQTTMLYCQVSPKSLRSAVEMLS